MNTRTCRVCLLLCAWFAAVVFVAGCAANSANSPMKDDFRQLLQSQKQKTEAIRSDEPDPPIAEMTFEDLERSGDNYDRQGNALMAMVQYNKALEKKPGDADLRSKVARLFLNRGMIEEATASYDAVLKDKPGNISAVEGKGCALFAAGKLDDAIDIMKQGLALKPDLWHPHFLLGIIYDRKKMYDEANSEYRQALALNPKAGMIWNNLGMSCYLSGKYQEAAEAFIKATRLDRDNRVAYNNLGLTLSQLERYDEAFAAFQRGGDKASALNNIGYIYLIAGRYEDALAAFEQAMAINPKYYEKAQQNLVRTRAAMISKNNDN